MHATAHDWCKASARAQWKRAEVALRFSANISFVFADLPWRERFGAAAAAGFEAVELNPPMPYLLTPGEFARELETHGFSCPLIVAPLGDDDCALGHACIPGAHLAFQQSILRAIDYSLAAGVKLIHPSAGRLPPGASSADGEAQYVENIAWAAERVAAAGLQLCIEPVCEMRTPGFFLQTTGQALDLIARTGRSDIALVFDIFHIQMQEGDAVARLDAVMPHIAHVQISDTPNRHVPGTGGIDFSAAFRALEREGYGGWIGCEYDDGGSGNPFGWAADWSHVALKTPRRAMVEGE